MFTVCDAKNKSLPPGQIYVSTVGAIACNYGAIPLFYEVAVDMAFPVPETLVAGVMTATDCFVSTLFLIILSIPNTGKNQIV